MGRRSHVVAAIPRRRMDDGSWERTALRRLSAPGAGFRGLNRWLAGFGLKASEIPIGLEPTRGWYSQTVAAWLARAGYEISWLQASPTIGSSGLSKATAATR